MGIEFVCESCEVLHIYIYRRQQTRQVEKKVTKTLKDGEWEKGNNVHLLGELQRTRKAFSS